MISTFNGCTSLVNAPVIPNSVTSMDNAFYNCTSLINAPVIPDSVMYMNYAFGYCSNLTGVVRINSSRVSKYLYGTTYNPFKDTSKPITVEVPSGSTTYTTINTNKPSNVTIVTY